MKRICFIVFIYLCIFIPSITFAGNIGSSNTTIVGDVLGLVVDTTNEANPSTSYYYFKLVSDGYNAFSAQHLISNVTVTYEGSNDLLSVADASATWTDITSMLTDGSTANFTSTGFLSVNQPVPWSRIRQKRVVSGALNELESRITRMVIK